MSTIFHKKPTIENIAVGQFTSIYVHRLQTIFVLAFLMFLNDIWAKYLQSHLFQWVKVVEIHGTI